MRPKTSFAGLLAVSALTLAGMTSANAHESSPLVRNGGQQSVYVGTDAMGITEIPDWGIDF